jgi:hypothetical protein
MTEIPLSIVAWISVVLIQAIIHYLVLGHRRSRMKLEAEDMTLEESLSLAETLSLADTVDESLSFTDLAAQDTNYRGAVSPARGDQSKTYLIKEVLVAGSHESHDDSQEFLDFISHTGSELLRVRYYDETK